MSVIREDLIEGRKWRSLASQGDPALEKLLRKQLQTPGKTYPQSKDWLTDQWRPGIWSQGWRFRRWALMPLGLDDGGRYTVMRPLYQYLISYVDRLGNVSLDSAIPARGDGSGPGWAFMPYVPHTVAPFGRPCRGCHLNRVAAGFGVFEKGTADTDLTIPSPPAVSTMRLMSIEERRRLLKPSNRWHKERLRAVLGKALEDSANKDLRRDPTE
jgi:hypothetical protein